MDPDKKSGHYISYKKNNRFWKSPKGAKYVKSLTNLEKLRILWSQATVCRDTSISIATNISHNRPIWDINHKKMWDLGLFSILTVLESGHFSNCKILPHLYLYFHLQNASKASQWQSPKVNSLKTTTQHTSEPSKAWLDKLSGGQLSLCDDK